MTSNETRTVRNFCHDLPTRPCPEIGRILITGGTGYVGGLLIPELLTRGYRIRIMVRGDSKDYIERWPGVELVEADALRKDSLGPALQGIHTAYYLIHSLLLGTKEFEAADILAATNFRDVAREKGVERIIYLGGMGDCETSSSPHMRSRAKVEESLASGHVSVTALRAAVIIGSGSASYEIIRHLVTKMPILLIPPWANNGCQPIGIRDVVKYLVAVLETPKTKSKSFDIGGMDVLTYEAMLKLFSEIIGKRTLFIAIPFGSTRVFSYIASLITPVPAQITAALMRGLKDEAVCANIDIRRYVTFQPLPYRKAVERALTLEQQDQVPTRWSDAYPPAHELATKLGELPENPTFVAVYSLHSEKKSSALFRSICSIGGKSRSDSDWLWRVRGILDRLLLGVGTARGRKAMSDLRINDVIDFWRVEDLRPGRLLLRAEMKLPGRAWLEFRVEDEEEKTRLLITAYFWTNSLFGKLYWYFFLPFHSIIFRDLLKHIEEQA